MRRIGIIGGTGLYRYGPGEPLEVETPYGTVTLTYSRSDGREVFFLPRHGPRHETPPNRVNARAQLKALDACRVDYVLGVFNTGAVAARLRPGAWVLPDDFVDHTRGRTSTFHDDDAFHVDMTEPFCPTLRGVLSSAGPRGLVASGTYAAVEGPRFESAAETRLLRAEGATIVGMTGVPEVVLARELGLCYAAVCFVANVEGRPVTGVDAIQAALARRVPTLRAWLRRGFAKLPARKPCSCAAKPKTALVRAPRIR